jgi:tetratricopeptide (TPR) repeat protein
MLRHLVRASEATRVLILGTYRPVELVQEGPLVAALAELRRSRGLHQIELDGLPEDEVSALIAARSGEGAAASLARQVAARTDGNPFFIEELLRHLEGDVTSELGQLELPDSVKDLLLRRLRRLDDDCQRALVFASVAGREFELVILERVLEHSEDELAELLERAIGAHVLVEEASAIGRYRFAHPLIREAIYDNVSLTRRALTHRRIGAAIESVYADRLSEHAGALARHFHAAGDSEKAFEFHNLAAAEAERGHAGETAFEHLTGAIAAGELLGRTPESDSVMRDLYRRRAWSGQFYGTAEIVQRDYQIALDGARAGGDGALEMRLLNELGTTYHVRNSTQSATFLEQSLELAEELGDEAGQVNALNRLSLLYGNQLDVARAERLGQRASTLARRGNDEWARLHALDALKFVALIVADIDRLEELTAELALALRSQDALWYLQWTLEESAFASIARHRFPEAATRIDEALAISKRIGDAFSRGLILTMRCRLEQARGDYASAIAAGEEAMQLTTDSKNRVWLGWMAGRLAAVMSDLRAWARALELLETACEAARRMDARAQLFSVLGDLAWARARNGDRAGARDAAGRWDAMLEDVRMPAGRAYLYSWHTYTNRARAALALGDVDRAETVMLIVSGPVALSAVRDAAVDVDAVGAACAAARGQPEAAVELLTRALHRAGDDGPPAARLALRIALAQLMPPGPGAADHVAAAHGLIEQIAVSVGNAQLAEEFGRVAGAELESEASSLGYPAADARHVTS